MGLHGPCPSPNLLTPGAVRVKVGAVAGTDEGGGGATGGGGGSGGGVGGGGVGGYSGCGCRRKRGGGGGGGMPTEREACGLGALLPVSCRGRAESFARRLHTRLRSLGGGGGVLGGSTDLLRGTDDEEEGLDFAGAMGGWGGSGDGDEVGDVYGSNGEASGGGRGAEGGCSAKYRSTDRGAPGTVTVQQPHPTPGPASHSPSPPAGESSPPFSSSPRLRLDSGLESLGSPTSGTPPRPESNGSESGVAGINTPANGYFSPPNDAGFSSGRWHASPSPEKEQQSRSPHQRIRRKRDIKWPPSHSVEPVVGEGDTSLPNFLECFPQTGVDSPPETSWSPSSMSPENCAGGGMRFASPGGIDEVDSRSAGDAYWNHYSYFKHGFPARSPATPPLLQSPDLLPLNAKGISSPTSYTPPCSPMSPVETHYAPLNCSPVMGVKSPISEGNEEEEEDGEAREQDEFVSQELAVEPLHNHNITHELVTETSEQEELINKHEEELSNGHSNDELPIPEEIEEITNPFVDPIQREMTEIDLLALDLSGTHLSNVELEKEDENASSRVEEEVAKSEDEGEESPPHTESNQEVDKVEKSAEEEDVLSEDSMERDIQNLAETIYGKGAGVDGMEDEEVVGFEGDVRNAVQLKPSGEGDCSPEEETTDEAELRKKYLDADSSVMDLKAVRIICEEMASRAMKGEGDTFIIGITEVEPSKGATVKVIEPEGGPADEGGAKCLEDKTPDYDDDEEETIVRVPRVRRSTSLKTGKTPPGTPSRKKFVRFADVLGLDLADVRTFLDEIPHVPRSAFQDLAPDPIVSTPSPWEMGPTSRVSTASRRPRSYHLIPIFPQPGAAADFFDRIRERFICLESAMEEDMEDEEDDGNNYFGVNGWSIVGTVRVRNIAFHKTVHARASADGWRSHADVPASYLPGSCDGFSDRFAFEIRPGIPPTGGVFGAAPFPRRLPNGGRLEFAVRFQCQGSQYWDNNFGANYVFSVEPLVNPAVRNDASAEEERPPATPAPNPRTSTKDFQYLSLPYPDVDWATFL